MSKAEEQQRQNRGNTAGMTGLAKVYFGRNAGGISRQRRCCTGTLSIGAFEMKGVIRPSSHPRELLVLFVKKKTDHSGFLCMITVGRN
ncbi:hypothetical protein Tco_1286044 [Tanacetum coccineum]